jgi:uncharacterized protein (TIGR03437 family)
LRYLCVLTLAFGLGFPLKTNAQNGVVVGAGYQLPQFAAAPGQVLTIFMQGITVPEKSLSAGSGQWPATLGGFSATLIATVAQGSGMLSVPIGSVFPFSNCGGTTTLGLCPTITGLTIQIPFEMFGATLCSLCFPPPLPAAVLTITDQNGHIAVADLNPLADQIHIVRSQDTILGGGGGGDPAVTHANGSAVSADSPAQAGEVLVMYVVGLGSTSPAVPDGAPAPASPLSMAQGHPSVHYDFAANAAPSTDVGGASTGDISPLFAGLAPGFVGLYQVNVQVPAVPPGTLPCVVAGSTNMTGVSSNLTLTLGRLASFDGVGICVAVNAN